MKYLQSIKWVIGISLSLTVLLSACGSGSTSNNIPVNNTSISTTLPNGTIVTIPVNQLSTTAGIKTTTTIMVSNAPNDFKMNLSYNNVVPNQHNKSNTNEITPILATFNPESVTGSNASVFSVMPRRDLTTGNYPITVSITYLNNGHESTTTMDPLNISVTTNTSPQLGTINLTPESITVGTEESKNIILSLNNSINVTNLNVTISSTDSSIASVTPNSCNLSTESPNCKLSVTGVNVESTSIVASAANYQSATTMVNVKNVYAYVTNTNSNTISMFRLNSTTGQLIPLSPESSIPTLGSPFALSIDPSGKHLYATITGDIESNVVSMFNIDPKTGLLTPLAPQSIPYIGTFALNMLINPLSGFLYLDTMTGSLSMFSIESATGILSPLTPPSINTASFCIGLTLSPNAKFMYNSCIDGSIIGYTIESNGLAEVSFMLNLQKGLSGATINQSGSILYTLDVYNNEALMFAIGSEIGDLTQLNPQIKISTQRTPVSIRLNKTNDFAYVTNLDSNSISMYSVEKDSGILIPLSPESSIATGTGPWDISFDPSEKFAYVTNANESTLSAYSVNQVTGELTPLAESSIPTGEGARIIVFN